MSNLCVGFCKHLYILKATQLATLPIHRCDCMLGNVITFGMLVSEHNRIKTVPCILYVRLMAVFQCLLKGFDDKLLVSKPRPL